MKRHLVDLMNYSNVVPTLHSDFILGQLSTINIIVDQVYLNMYCVDFLSNCGFWALDFEFSSGLGSPLLSASTSTFLLQKMWKVKSLNGRLPCSLHLPTALGGLRDVMRCIPLKKKLLGSYC